ncbi:MAG: hypothetical protein ABS939_13705 [Psychrobacillus sp.]
MNNKKETMTKDLFEAIDKVEEFYNNDLSEDAKDMFLLVEDIIFYVREIVEKQ